jgi:hypothetical protein
MAARIILPSDFVRESLQPLFFGKGSSNTVFWKPQNTQKKRFLLIFLSIFVPN